MGEMQNKWYIEQLTAPAMFNRNAVKFGHWTFQQWKTGPNTKASNTYAEAWKIVKELSSGLIDMGIQKGDRCAVMSNTCPEWVWADYSILSAGAITACIYPSLSESEMTYILNDSGARILYIHKEEDLKKVLNIWSKLPALEKVIMMQDSFEYTDNRVLSFTPVRKRGVALLTRDRFAFEHRWRSIQLTDLMTIVYTSGTTGVPKGAVHTHLSFNTALCRDLRDAPEYREGDVLLSFLPLSHTYERESGHGCAMMGGVSIAYTTPKTLVEDLQLFKPHIFMSVPRIYERVYMAMKEMSSKSPVKKFIFDAAMKTGIKVVEAASDKNGFVPASEGVDLGVYAGFFTRCKYRVFQKIVFSKVHEKFGGRMRAVFSAAGSLPADLCKTFLAMGFVILEGYGLTETWNAINLNRPGKVLPGSVGLISSGVTGRIADDGEWQVKGENLFVGYWNKPGDTAAAFTEDGFFKTGDIVEEVADGYLKIVDRKKGIMVLDTGKNIPSARIESMFALSNYIEMVVPIADDRKFVSALVVPDFNAVIKFCDENGIAYDKSSLEYSHEAAVPLCTRVGNDIIENEKVRQCIDADIQTANRELEEYERIKKYHVLNRKLTEQEGEVTPTFKVRRKEVINKFKDEIEKLYV